MTKPILLVLSVGCWEDFDRKWEVLLTFGHDLPAARNSTIARRREVWTKRERNATLLCWYVCKTRAFAAGPHFSRLLSYLVAIFTQIARHSSGYCVVWHNSFCGSTEIPNRLIAIGILKINNHELIGFLKFFWKGHRNAIYPLSAIDSVCRKLMHLE